jgi:tetratricopeptide (TPR) repeat protein
LNELAVRAQDARLLLVVSCRPEYKDEWKGRPNYRQLRLNPLASESFAELLQALLGSDPSVETIKSFLIERASGNPFFVEEIVRSLVDGAVLEGARGKYRLARPFVSNDVPPTVQAVLAARIDKLPATEKRLLQEAAVVGHDFSFTLLQAISGLAEDDLRALLDDLQAAEFLYTTQLFPDLQYTFTHALTHDVAYNELLQQRRRDTHARVVDAMEKLYADRLGEHAERLAHHAVRGELKDKAVHYLHLAGDKAAARSALADARSCFEEALGILKELPESQATLERGFEIRLDLRPVLRQLGEGRRQLEHLREAEIIATQLKDDRRRGQVCAFMTTVQSTLDDLDEALDSGSRALEIAERLHDVPLRIIATSFLEQAHCYRGDYERVVALATNNLDTLPADSINAHFGMAVPASIFDRAWLVMSLAELGRFAEAAKYEAEAIRIAEPTQHAFSIGWAHFAASMPHLLQGDWAKALSLIEQWLMMLRTGNVSIHLPWAVASSAWAMAEIGESRDTPSRIQEAEALLERQAGQGIVGHRSWAYHAVGRALLRLGQLDKARGLAERAIETSTRQPGFAAHAHHLLGDIETSAERFDHERGVGHYRDALALAQRHGMRPLVAHGHLGLGKIHRRAGKATDAEHHHATATAMYRDMDMRFWLAQAQH